MGGIGFEQCANSRENATSASERSIFVASVDGLATWLNACPIALDDATRGGILATIRAADGRGRENLAE